MRFAEGKLAVLPTCYLVALRDVVSWLPARVDPFGSPVIIDSTYQHMVVGTCWYCMITWHVISII